MRYYLYSFIVQISISSSVIMAQTDVSVPKKDFNINKTGFQEAWKHVSEGDKFYSDGGIWYNSALVEYLKANEYNNSNPELNYKIGVSALFSERKEEASGYFLKSLENKKVVAEDILLLAGRALQYSGKFPEAIEKFSGYLNSGGKKPEENVSLARKCIQECNSAILIIKDTLRFKIENMGASINSNSDEYSELFSRDGKTIYFASRRELSKSSNYYPDSKFDENIFVSILNANSWTLATLAGKEITTKYCETPLYIDSTNTLLYIYAGYENGGEIMVSQSRKAEWRAPKPVPFGISSGDSETSFTFSPSGLEIYFVTDNGKDNLGRKDIFFIKKLKEHKWSKPQNAGSGINTQYDEESLRFSKKGDTLWFSSKGHNTVGGFDIFYSVKNQAGEWGKAINCGYPVNTPWDEIFYYPSPVEERAFYFVSDRTGGFGGLDIYKGHILPPEPVDISLPQNTQIPDSVVVSDTSVVVSDTSVVATDTTVVVKEAAPPTAQPEPLTDNGLQKDVENKVSNYPGTVSDNTIFMGGTKKRRRV